MKRQSYAELSADELHVKEREMTEQIFRLKFQAATGQGEGLRKLRELKKDLARVKTFLRQYEMQAAAAKK